MTVLNASPPRPPRAPVPSIPAMLNFRTSKIPPPDTLKTRRPYGANPNPVVTPTAPAGIVPAWIPSRRPARHGEAAAYVLAPQGETPWMAQYAPAEKKY